MGSNAIVNFTWTCRQLHHSQVEIIASGTALRLRRSDEDGAFEERGDDECCKKCKGKKGKDSDEENVKLSQTEELIKVLMVSELLL